MFNKILLALVASAAVLPMAHADEPFWSVAFGAPGFVGRVGNVYVAPQPVYVAPPPVQYVAAPAPYDGPDYRGWHRDGWRGDWHGDFRDRWHHREEHRDGGWHGDH